MGASPAGPATCECERRFHFLPLPAAIVLPVTVRLLHGDDLGHGHGAGACKDSAGRVSDTLNAGSRRQDPGAVSSPSR